MSQEQSNATSSATERRGLAISGMIMALVGLACAFIYGWRWFAIIISFVAMIVSTISLQKAMKFRKTKTKQVVGILASLAAIMVGSYFLYTGPAEKHILEGDKMPVKVHEDGVPGSKDENLEKVKEVIDSTYTE